MLCNFSKDLCLSEYLGSEDSYGLCNSFDLNNDLTIKSPAWAGPWPAFLPVPSLCKRKRELLQQPPASRIKAEAGGPPSDARGGRT